MQALRQRTAQAIIQIERRQKRQSDKKSAVLRRERVNKEVQRNAVLRKNRFLVKQEKWEEHFLGELKSSKGWLSSQRENMPTESAMSQWERNHQKRLRMLRAKLQIAREDSLLEKEERRKMPEYHVAKGDRIVIKATEGPCARYRGEIGTVIAVNKQRRVCVVEGMTIRQARAPKEVPLYTLFNEPSYDPEHLVLLPIPFSHMRMVKTVINGAGEKEDVVLGHLTPEELLPMGQKKLAYNIQNSRIESPGKAALKAARAKAAETIAQARAATEQESEDEKLALEQTNVYDNQPAKKSKKEPGRLTKLYYRLTGKKLPEENKEYENFLEDDPTTPSDTLRIDIDAPSWAPTLLRAPLPGTVIDELRGKYSKFRTRHDPEFIKRMQRIDSARQSRERWVKSGGGVLDTPRQEAALRSQAKKRDERLKKGPLDEKVLEGIGRLMWERGMRLDPTQELEVKRNKEREMRKALQGPLANLVAADHSSQVGRTEGDKIEA